MKNVPNRTKIVPNVREQYLFQIEKQMLQKDQKNCDLTWSYMAFFIVLHDFFVVVYGLLSCFMACYGLLWQKIDLMGLVLSFLAVIDPNSFILVPCLMTIVDRVPDGN